MAKHLFNCWRLYFELVWLFRDSAGEPEKTNQLTQTNPKKVTSSSATKQVKITDCIQPSKSKEIGKAENQVKEKEVSQDVERNSNESDATNTDTRSVTIDSNKESLSESSETPRAAAGGHSCFKCNY